MMNSGDRIGFDAPVYVDFLSNARWTDVTFVGRYRACFVLVEEQFFMESTQQIRSKISEGIMRFVQSPFTPMDESESKRLQRLEEAMMATLHDGRSVFVRELLQTMACAWQYELWNIFFRRLQASRTEAKPYWGDTAAQFFYLAHTHCREQHEVGWYARQVGLSPTRHCPCRRWPRCCTLPTSRPSGSSSSGSAACRPCNTKRRQSSPDKVFLPVKAKKKQTFACFSQKSITFAA